MVCLTNCSFGAWFSCYLFNAIICPQTKVQPKEKNCMLQNSTVRQKFVQTLKLTKQPAEMVCFHSSRVQVCIYWVMYLLVNLITSAVHWFNNVQKKKEILADYVEWKNKRIFTSCGYSSRSTVFGGSPLPANMSTKIPFKNCVLVRFCGGVRHLLL